MRGERSQNRSFSRDEKRERVVVVVVVVVVVQTIEASAKLLQKRGGQSQKRAFKRYPDKRQRYISTPSIFQFDIRRRRRRRKEHHHLGEMMIRVVVVVVVVAVAVVVPSRSPRFHGWWWYSLCVVSVVRDCSQSPFHLLCKSSLQKKLQAFKPKLWGKIGLLRRRRRIEEHREHQQGHTNNGSCVRTSS